MFYVGQKVVCINDEPAWLTGEKLLSKGQIYTVIGMNYYLPDDVFIVGFVLSWDSSRFAPIEEYSDSMSIAMQLIQELDQVDKAKNPIKEGAKV